MCLYCSLLFSRSGSSILCSSIFISLPSWSSTLDRSVSFFLSAVLLRPPARWLNLIFHMHIALPPMLWALRRNVPQLWAVGEQLIVANKHRGEIHSLHTGRVYSGSHQSSRTNGTTWCIIIIICIPLLFFIWVCNW